jgi:hypothetical protein
LPKPLVVQKQGFDEDGIDDEFAIGASAHQISETLQRKFVWFKWKDGNSELKKTDICMFSILFDHEARTPTRPSGSSNAYNSQSWNHQSTDGMRPVNSIQLKETLP